MPVEEPGVRDGLMALAAAGAGRLLLLVNVSPDKMTVARVLRALVVEIPLTAGVALLGWAACRALELDEPRQIVAIALLARYGPDRVEMLLERILPRGPRP